MMRRTTIKKTHRKFHIGYTKIIVISFLLAILIGAGLLTLPISSRTGQWTDFTSCLFTATSATCVTGLTVKDTLTHWSTFGHVVIICLIQIGGLGVMTIFSLFSIILSKNASLHSRALAMQASGALSYQSIYDQLKRILKGTFFFEFLGAAVLCVRFVPKYAADGFVGIIKGIWYSVFHSVSAFCNAGFDLSGPEVGSLVGFNRDPLVMLTIAFLIITGGIGFIVWDDFAKHKLRFHYFSLHSKITLTVTFFLLTLGTGAFYGLEFRNAATIGNMSVGEGILNSLFQATTLRTAGFYSVPQGSLSDGSIILSDFLMLIGGSAGSTAGGMKTTTFAVLLISVLTAFKKNGVVTVFKRKISDENVKNAHCIAIIYVITAILATTAICGIDYNTPGVSTKSVFFEVASAIATVGSSMGITASLATASKYILIFLMFVGRIGGLTFLLTFAGANKNQETTRPSENVVIG